MIDNATVVQQFPDQYRVLVSIDSRQGQMPFIPVQLGTHGPRDAVRGHYRAVPLPGTRGVVMFPRGDERCGVWVCAVDPSLPNASTLSPGNSATDYNALHGGGWTWEGADGTTARQWPDGSTLLLGASMPVPTRHTLNPQGQVVRTPFTAAERNPNPPSAFQLDLQLASGASVVVSAAGAVTVTAAAGQVLTLAVTGGATLTLNPDGTVRASGEVFAGYGSGDQVSVQQHTHKQPNDSHGDTEQPTNAPTAGT